MQISFGVSLGVCDVLSPKSSRHVSNCLTADEVSLLGSAPPDIPDMFRSCLPLPLMLRSTTTGSPAPRAYGVDVIDSLNLSLLRDGSSSLCDWPLSVT